MPLSYDYEELYVIECECAYMGVEFKNVKKNSRLLMCVLNKWLVPFVGIIVWFRVEGGAEICPTIPVHTIP